MIRCVAEEMTARGRGNSRLGHLLVTSPSYNHCRMSNVASTSRWSLDYSTSPSSSALTSIDPPGYVPALTKASSKNATSMIQATDLGPLRQQKAWEVALAPAKSVPMQAFMMYMTGGGIQIFSVMSVWFLLKGAVTSILSVEKPFAPFVSRAAPIEGAAPEQGYFLQKAVFVLCNIGLIAVGLWKCNQLGLLPTHESDWLAFREMPVWGPGPSFGAGTEGLVTRW